MQLRSLLGRSLRPLLGQVTIGQGGSSSASLSTHQSALSYASAKDTYVKMLKGELSGVATEAQADEVLQLWAEAAGDAWLAEAITTEQLDADMDLAQRWHVYALQRIASGSQPQYQQQGSTGVFYQGQAPSLVAPGTSPPMQPQGSSGSTSWLIAGGIGVAAIVLLTLLRRNK